MKIPYHKDLVSALKEWEDIEQKIYSNYESREI